MHSSSVVDVTSMRPARRRSLARLGLAVTAVGIVALAGVAYEPGSAAAGPYGNGVGCSDGNSIDGDCCSAASLQEESRYGLAVAAPGVVLSRSLECESTGINVCEDGVDNDGDGRIDSEDPECATMNDLQRQAVLANDATAPTGLRFGSEVRILHRNSAGAAPEPDAFFLYGVCAAGLCACPDTVVDADPNDPNAPPLSRPGCEIAGRSCTTDLDCEPHPYPAGQSHAGVCGVNVVIRRDSTIEGNLVATGNTRFGRGYVRSSNLVNVGSTFFCDGCVERVNRNSTVPNVRLDGEAPYAGPGLCMPSASKSCFAHGDCCENDRVTCSPPALPGDLCVARLQLDFLDANDPEHNPYVVLSGGIHDPNDPNSPANDYDRCVRAQEVLAALRDDSGDPKSIGSINLPGLPLTAAPAVHASDSVFVPSAATARLTFSGGGTHVRDIDFINMRRAANLEIEAPADAVLVLRVLGSLRVGGENGITLVPPNPGDPADVVSPDNILWILDSARGANFISRDVSFPGTIAAPSRSKLKLGGNTGVDGAIWGQEIDLRGLNEIRHRPFVPLLPTHLEVTKAGAPDPQNPDAPAGQVVAGENILYTIQVDNHGPSLAPGVVLTDNLPAEVTFNTATITQGSGSCEYVADAHAVLCYLGTLDRSDDPATGLLDDEATIEISVTTLANTRGGVANTAVVTANVEQAVAGANEDSIVTQVIGISDLNVVTKSDSPDPAIAGAAAGLVYTIEVENLGPSAAFEADPPGVRLTDVIPANLSIVSAIHQPGDGGAPQPCDVSGQTVICNMGRIDVIDTQPDGTEPNREVVTIVVTPDCDAHVTHPPASPLANTATVSNSGELDPVAPNDSASSTTGFTGDVDLSSSKTDSVGASPGYVIAGANMTYTVTVNNSGPSDATSVVVTDTLPAGLAFSSGTDCNATGGTPYVDQQVTCTVPTIGCGSAANRTFSVNVAASVAEGTTVTNVVNGLAQAESEIGAGDEASSRNTLVRRRANLAIAKTRTSPVAACIPGESVSYQLVATNSGPSDATGAALSDSFASELTNCTWTCVAAGNASCPAAGVGSINTAVDIDAGGGNSVTFAAVCDIDPSARGTNGDDSDSLGNTASIATEAGTLNDPAPGNNSSTNTCALDTDADLTLTVSDSGYDPVAAGTPAGVVYELTIDNAGPANAIEGDVTLSATLPAGVAFVSAVHSGGGSCLEVSGVVSCNLGTIAVSDPAETVLITITPDCDVRGALNLSAEVTTGGEDDPGSPNAVTETTTIEEDVALTITKNAAPAAVEEDVDVLTYTITVGNGAAYSCAVNATVGDTLDTALQDIVITPSQGACAAFPCNLGALAAGANATITVEATAANGTAVNNDTTFDEVSNVATVDSDEPEVAQTSAPAVATDVLANRADSCTLNSDCATQNCVSGMCCGVPQVQPGNLFVDPAGGPGVYSTIQSALNAAVAGDTIVVQCGTYDEPLTFNKAVTLRGDHPSTTRITHTGAASPSQLVMLGANTGLDLVGDAAIENFTFHNGGKFDGGKRLILFRAKSSTGTITVRNNVFACSGDDPNYPKASGTSPAEALAESYNSYNFEIVDNEFRNCRYGIYLNESRDVTIAGNSFTGYLSNGVKSGSGLGVGGNGAAPNNPRDTTVTCNTFTNLNYGFVLANNIQDYSFTGNVITGSHSAAILYWQYGTYVYWTGVNFSANDIVGNSVAARGFSPVEGTLPVAVSAEGNWWEVAPPRTTLGAGNEIVLGNLDYDPWATGPVADLYCNP